MPFAFSAPLYAIIDPLAGGPRSPLDLAAAVLAAGAPLLQLRCKREPSRRFVELARAVNALAEAHGARLIINDRADIARLVGAAGVHLGQDDLPVAAARAVLGPAGIIGLSTHSPAQVAAAAATGADYVAFGPIYATTGKERPDPAQGLEGLRQVRPLVSLPLVAIGGIGAGTTAEVLAAGADAVAMIGALARAPDVTAFVCGLLALCTAGAAPFSV